MDREVDVIVPCSVDGPHGKGRCEPVGPTVVRIVASGPGYSIVESDCDGPMAGGRIFDSPKAAKHFAYGYGWVVDESWNREVML